MREPATLKPPSKAVVKRSEWSQTSLLAYIGRGLIYLKMGELDEAEEDFAIALSLDPGLYREEYAVIFPDILQKLEEAEAPWNELRDALLHAQAELAKLNAAPERREGWAALIEGALEAVGALEPLRKDIPRLNRAAKRLAVAECRDVRLELGIALNKAMRQLRSLTAFRAEMRRHALALEASGDEKKRLCVRPAPPQPVAGSGED